MSILEISHRSKTFEEIIRRREADIRKLAGDPGRYHVLFLQGGASLQFSMVPMNLLPRRRQGRLHRHRRLVEEGGRRRRRRSAGLRSRRRPRPTNFTRIPEQSELKLDPEAAYVHITTNNTIYGTRVAPRARSRRRAAGRRRVFGHLQPADRRRAVRADLRRRAEEPRAGRRDAGDHSRRPARPRARRACRRCSTTTTHAKEKSLYNTPPVFAIYVIGLVLKWLLEPGRARGDGEAQRREGGSCSTTRSTPPAASTGRTRSRAAAR